MKNLYIFEFRNWWPATDKNLPARWSPWAIYPTTVAVQPLRTAIAQLRLLNQAGETKGQQFRLVTYRRARGSRYAA